MAMMIPGKSVELEAQFREPKGALRGAAVFCHPHPLYGGTMDNRIVYRAAKAALQAGFASLRFNFRGVGQSTGQYDQGIGEKVDAAEAVRWLGEKYPSMPLALIGYSFGAWIGLQVGCSDIRIKAMVGLAPPLDLYDFEFLLNNSKPTLYIVGTRDEFCSQENLDRLESRLPISSSLRRIEDAEHFFAGREEVIQALITNFLKTLPLDRDTA
jgi:alpha/beta superfamily hydrolase